MQYIKGKYKSSIFNSDSGYLIGLFRVKEASDELSDIVNKTITFTGYFPELNNEDIYELFGEYVLHNKYGYQFQVTEFKKCEPVGVDAVYEFLASSFVKGCGERTAKKIVDNLGENAVELIKNDPNCLYKIGLGTKTVSNIYNSIISYYNQDQIIIYLRELNFSFKEITVLLNQFGEKIKVIIDNDLYSLVEFIDFKKLDMIYFMLHEETNKMRKHGLILESIKRLCFEGGHIFVYKNDIVNYIKNNFDIDLFDEIEDLFIEAELNANLKIINDRVYLMEYYLDEKNIADSLWRINENDTNMSIDIDRYISDVESVFNVKYNNEQIKAIKEVMNNSVTIITGGPGTGKTTIINAILRVFQAVNRLSNGDMASLVSLLAPTGRASKRMMETTGFGASTIHRYLKWNKETKEFAVNKYNKTRHKLIIVDEVSMIDNNLMSSLLYGIGENIKLVLVGDEHQLPSVGPGNILKDIIASDMFAHIRLKNIYRQSDNSFIPIIAQEIKNYQIESDITIKRDDYNFLSVDKSLVKSMLTEIIKRSLEKGLLESDIEVLAPMYKGINGIDNINVILQEILNPRTDDKDEVEIGNIIYRVNDRVIYLINNVDANVFNGDIGYIVSINKNKSSEFMTINFMDNLVTIKRDELNTIKHAYCLSIHKSQGSEFNHVIMPITKEYTRMLYNRLLYTGISRAKKSLVLIGEVEAFIYAVNNKYSVNRNTSLEYLLTAKINE